MKRTAYEGRKRAGKQPVSARGLGNVSRAGARERGMAGRVRPKRREIYGIFRIDKMKIYNLAERVPLVSVVSMTLGEKLKTIRRDCGLSQEAIGAQGFVSTPGWIKLENAQRSPSEKLLDKLVTWLVTDKYIRASTSKTLREELLTLKYLGSNSKFVRELALGHAKRMPNGDALLVPTPASQKPKRGRPKLTGAR